MVKPIFHRIFTISLILILFFTSNPLNLNQPQAIITVTAETIIVNITGSANFTSIQEAIDQAEHGDTVYVEPGIYYENVTINKSINLIGAGAEHTSIIGDQVRAVIKLESNNSRISGFAIAGYYCYSGRQNITWLLILLVKRILARVCIWVVPANLLSIIFHVIIPLMVREYIFGMLRIILSK